jgi:glycosyltransferase involved in cell wall biosynthesis
MQPRVSVILPIYNGERYLDEAIESVLSQTYAHYEIIAVNDGSRDRSAAIVRKHLPSERIKYIEQANQGVASARNTGIEQSSGEFITFLDQDDLWLPQKLEKQVAFMESHSDVALVHSRVECIDGAGIPISCKGHVYVDETTGYCAQSLLVGNRIAVLTVMLRRSCLDVVGRLNQTLAPSDDWDLWLRLAVHYPFGFMDEVLAKYRVHDSNESRHVLKMRLAEIGVLETFRAREPGIIQSANRYEIDTALIGLYKRTAQLLSDLGRHDEATGLRRKWHRVQLRAPWYYAACVAALFPAKLQPRVRWYCHRLFSSTGPRAEVSRTRGH